MPQVLLDQRLHEHRPHARKVCPEHIGVQLVTHDHDLARLSDRALEMKDGRFV